MSWEKVGAAGLLMRSFLSVPECVEVIKLAEDQGFEPAPVRAASGVQQMPHIRNNQRAILESDWVQSIWARLSVLPLPIIDGQSAVGLPRALRFYKYEPGERFKMHKDGPWQEDGLTSQLTVLVYLNDTYVGGETAFRDYALKAEPGSLLLFPHKTWHEGVALIEGTKYVLRTDVLYR